MKIDWSKLPYDHAGRWQKCIPSIMNPGTNVTWPQHIVEHIIYNRREFIDKYKSLKIGPGWSQPIGKEVGKLCQQASVIMNYFPHPDDDPDVARAINSYLKKYKPLKIGQLRKTRIVVKDGKSRINITNDEKYFVRGVMVELERIRNAMKNVPKFDDNKDVPAAEGFRTNVVTKKSRFGDLFD